MSSAVSAAQHTARNFANHTDDVFLATLAAVTYSAAFILANAQSQESYTISNSRSWRPPSHAKKSLDTENERKVEH